MVARPTRFLAAAHVMLFWLSHDTSSLCADGFTTTVPLPRINRDCQHPTPISTLALSSNDNGAHTSIISPTQPDDDIEANALLSQAYDSLSVKQLRDLLRRNDARVSGNKRELVERLGEILDPSNKATSQPNSARSDTAPLVIKSGSTPHVTKSSSNCNNGGRRELLASYERMTLHELKDILRQCGARVSGNKRELVQRLINLGYNPQTKPRKCNSHVDGDDGQSWSVLEPSVPVVVPCSNNATTVMRRNEDDDVELPCLSGLLFVNKPSGYSTLPTKQQLDDPSNPKYPCLSDSVKEWLSHHPEGRRRMERAQNEEGLWWEYTLQTTPSSSDPKRRRKLKKRKDKMEAKLETFEPRPVHRLDIDTSGVVCIALTPYALRAANMLFEKKSRGSVEDGRIENAQTFESNEDDMSEAVRKRYVALVEGTLGGAHGAAPSSGAVSHPIGKVWMEDHNEWACDISIGNGKHVAFLRPHDTRANATVLVPDSSRGAYTSYRAVDWTTTMPNQEGRGGERNVTRVELVPHTGRGHQLRLHMASLGHEIVGDDMHGTMALPSKGETRTASSELNGGRLCLHASNLSIHAWCCSEADGTGDGFEMCRVDVESAPPF